jgi:hypothetical protein
METDKSRAVVTGRAANGTAGEHAGLGYHADSIAASTPTERGGFSGTCETTLADWIQLVQMGRRDAVVSVCTYDGHEGTLWCRDGDIIDAACDGLSGEDAVYRTLSWQGGRVSVEFEGFEHRRKIHTPTAGLLLTAAYRTDIGVPDLVDPHGAAGLTPLPEIPGPIAEPATPGAPQAAQQRRHRRLVQVLAGAGGLLPFVLFSILAGRWLPSEYSPRAPAATPFAVFDVHIDAEPPQAAILLDGRQVGVGQFEKSLAQDGRVHEIVCAAEGYVSERLVFRDVPPRQRVILAPSDVSVSVPDPTATLVVHARRVAPSQPAQANGGSARRRVVAPRGKPSVMWPSAVSSTAPETAREAAPTPAKVQVIEARRPVIQIIEDHSPRIDVIE